MKQILFIILALILLVSVVSIAETNALTKEGPLYTTGKYTSKWYITFKDRCWHEIYIRFVDRDDRHAVLNTVTYEKAPTEKVTYMKVILPFDSKKIESGRIRYYITVDDVLTQNKYTNFDPKQLTYPWYFTTATSGQGC
jgi:hypothetical protein